jgi:segregation and condensation protein B
VEEALDPLVRDLEAVLFAAGRPLDLAALVQAASHAYPAGEQEVTAALGRLEAAFPVDGARGFELTRLAEGWVFRTNRLCEGALSAAFDVAGELRLSPAALETLAIVAYLQPVSRPEIAEIRGVNSDSAVQTLVDRELILETGRRDDGGGAILFGTTRRFQVAFGLDGLEELPALEGFTPGEAERDELRRRLGLLVSPE